MGRHSAPDDRAHPAAEPSSEPAPDTDESVEQPRHGPLGWPGPEPDPTSKLGWPGDLVDREG
jgi:hypothetical protein